MSGRYQRGDMPPSPYLAWHAWAAAQHAGGLRQTQCGLCALWQFPQELSERTHTFEAFPKQGGRVTLTARICRSCAAGMVTV